MVGCARFEPSALLGDGDGNDFVLVAIERIDYRFGGAKRDFMFTGAATENHAYSEFCGQCKIPCPCPGVPHAPCRGRARPCPGLPPRMPGRDKPCPYNGGPLHN